MSESDPNLNAILGHTLLDASQLFTLLEGFGEASPDAMFAKDLDGRYLWMNAACAAHVGLKASEAAGRLDREFMSAESFELLHEVDLKVMQSQVPITIEQTFYVEGKERIFLMSKRPLWDGAHVVGLVGTARETTEQRHAESALREQNRLYEAVLSVEAEVSQEQGDYYSLLLTVLGAMSRITEADGASLEIPDGDEMVYEAATGIAAPFLGFRLQTSASLSGELPFS